MSSERRRLPPPWFIRGFGAAHRTLHRLSGGRLGLSHPKSDRWGEMCLMTVGRRSGRERSAILGYLEDGANLVFEWPSPVTVSEIVGENKYNIGALCRRRLSSGHGVYICGRHIRSPCPASQQHDSQRCYENTTEVANKSLGYLG